MLKTIIAVVCCLFCGVMGMLTNAYQWWFFLAGGVFFLLGDAYYKGLAKGIGFVALEEDLDPDVVYRIMKRVDIPGVSFGGLNLLMFATGGSSTRIPMVQVPSGGFEDFEEVDNYLVHKKHKAVLSKDGNLVLPKKIKHFA